MKENQPKEEMKISNYFWFYITIVLTIIFQSCSSNITGVYYKRGQKEDTFLHLDSGNLCSINYRNMYSNYWVNGTYKFDINSSKITLITNKGLSISSVMIDTIGIQHKSSLLKINTSPDDSTHPIDSVMISFKNRRMPVLYNIADTISVDSTIPFSVSVYYKGDSLVYKVNNFAETYFPQKAFICSINTAINKGDTLILKRQSRSIIKSINNNKYIKLRTNLK